MDIALAVEALQPVRLSVPAVPTCPGPREKQAPQLAVGAARQMRDVIRTHVRGPQPRPKRAISPPSAPPAARQVRRDGAKRTAKRRSPHSMQLVQPLAR